MLFQTNTFRNLKYYKFMRYAASKKCPVLPHSPLVLIQLHATGSLRSVVRTLRLFLQMFLIKVLEVLDFGSSRDIAEPHLLTVSGPYPYVKEFCDAIDGFNSVRLLSFFPWPAADELRRLEGNYVLFGFPSAVGGGVITNLPAHAKTVSVLTSQLLFNIGYTLAGMTVDNDGVVHQIWSRKTRIPLSELLAEAEKETHT